MSKEEEVDYLPPPNFDGAIKFTPYNRILKLPSSSSTFYHSLQVLDITGSPRLAHNYFSEKDWFSSVFPAIKKLNLFGVKGIDNLNITSSSLEHLEIIACDLHRVVVSAERLQTLCVMFYRVDWLFTMYAPSLQKLRFCDNHYSFHANSMCLESVNIDAPIVVEYSAANTSKNLLELLQFMNHAKSILLLGSFLKEGLFTLDSPPYMLNNVHNLEVACFSKKDHKIPALASLFRMFPNLKTLTMGCGDLSPPGYELSNLLALDQRKFDIQYWESHDFAFIHQLEEANIEINKWAFEVGLIKYLIQHAKALHTMTVTFAHNIDISRSRQIRDELSEFYENYHAPKIDLCSIDLNYF